MSNRDLADLVRYELLRNVGIDRDFAVDIVAMRLDVDRQEIAGRIVEEFENE